MANLIPQENKKWIRNDYLLRVLVVWLSVFAFIIIAATASIVPTYVMLQTKLDGSKTATQAVDNNAAEINASSTEKLIKELRSRVDLLKTSIGAQSVSLGIIPELFKLKPEAMYISSISFSKSGRKITVRGVADTNKDLGLFINAIKNQKEPKTFLPIETFPFAAMSQPTDVSFSLEIRLKDTNAK